MAKLKEQNWDWNQNPLCDRAHAPRLDLEWLPDRLWQGSDWLGSLGGGDYEERQLAEEK